MGLDFFFKLGIFQTGMMFWIDIPHVLDVFQLIPRYSVCIFLLSARDYLAKCVTALLYVAPCCQLVFPVPPRCHVLPRYTLPIASSCRSMPDPTPCLPDEPINTFLGECLATDINFWQAFLGRCLKGVVGRPSWSSRGQGLLAIGRPHLGRLQPTATR